MVTIKLIVLSLAILGSQASFPDTPTGPPTRNTITAEEKFEGGVFEDVDTVIDTRNIAPEAYRLPTTTKPSHYDVLWTIDIERLTYSGTVSIYLSATSAGNNEIVIHNDHSAIISVALTLGNVAIPTTYRTDPEPQFLIVSLTNNNNLTYNATSPVIYTLTISFGAELREEMSGIYKSWFRNTATDTPRYMATTQFQATAARYAFPCYDEPSFKATFNITIRRPNAFRSWSCTRIRENSTVVANYTDDVYHTTPVMSTYLLAFIVAEYDSIEYRENNDLMYEVIARPGAITANQGQYAFDVGQDLLTAMNDHTGLDFHTVHPHIKMTQAAIPDFSAGAMENWGLLTYREAYLMYDPEHTSSYFKQLIAYILSHEIAHMWFGNLVTCDWWDVLWLNEGFARYYQYFLTHWVEDYMGLETRFITEQIHTSLLTDSANNPQQLTSSGIGSPTSVRSMFGTLTYNKGAAVIRMTEHLLGFEIHRQGLQNYLVDRSFDIAQPIHLFEALQNVSLQYGAIAQYGDNFNFIDYYKSWTEQPGHPVLNVQVDHSTGRMTIYQRRFNINTGYSYTDTNYIVPITFATASNPDFTNTKPSHVLTKSVTVIDRGSVGDEWVIFNKQQTGFYRVNYDDYTWDLIVLTLRGANRTLIHEYNRAQIVNDVFQFARSGLISYSRAFNILSFLEFETDYAPWVAATTGFAWIRNRLVGTPQWTSLNELVARWATRVMGELTYSPIANESFMRSYLRYQLAPVMCLMGVQACRTAATTQFNALRITGTEVPVDSRNWVYCNALRDGTTDDFNFLYQRFQNHNVYTEKIQIVWVLGCTPHQTSLNTLLTAIVQDNYIIRPQDYTNAWSGAVSGNEGNTQIVFQYIQNNLNAVRNGFGSLTTPLSYVSARLRTAAEITAFENWVNQNQVILGDEYSAILNGASASRQNIEWAAEVAGDMNNYFVNGGETVVTSTQATTVSTSPVTVSQPNLVEPSTPSLPERDAASTTFLSLILVTMALIANIVI